MKKLKVLMVIINFKTLIIIIASVISSYLCRKFNFVASFPMSLIATAVVFPIVFSIGSAYKRRETALTKYSSLKAHARVLYFCSRDWIKNTDENIQNNIKSLLGKLLFDCGVLFATPVSKSAENEKNVYKTFSKISCFINEDLKAKEKGLSAGEISRCNQFLSKMLVAFEDMKHIYQYRTPRTLAAFSELFLSILPVIYGPYFATISKNYSECLVYVMPILCTTVLVSLGNIQKELENPFDQIGEDDIRINSEKFVELLDAK